MNTSTIRFKVKVLLGLFAGFMLVTVALSFYVLNSQSADARVINIAGRQRMLTQKMTKDVLTIVADLQVGVDAGDSRATLMETVDLFEKSLNALKDGGVTMMGGAEVIVPASKGDARIQFDKVAEMWPSFKKSVEAVATPGVNILTNGMFWMSLGEVKDGNIPILKESNTAVGLLKVSSERKGSVLKTVQLIALIVTILLAAVSLYLANRILLKPLNNVIDSIKDIAEGEGDLTKRVEVSSKDEIGELAKWFNVFVEKLHGIISDVSANATTLASSSVELSTSSTQIANGAGEQSLKASQVATASQEMSATIVEVAKNSSGASEAAREADKAASKGGEIVTKTIESMNNIARTTKESSSVIASLGERSHEIGEIISVIDDIADQTNLLALNAAIEAARAGEQGRGFAVVADEVRKLAERTTKATKEIGGMIQAIQDDTGKALASMEEEVKVVEDGVNLATEAGNALNEILGEVDKVTSMIQQIATASEEQSNAADQISGDIEAVAIISKESASSSQQIAEQGKEIAEASSELMERVGVFKVS